MSSDFTLGRFMNDVKDHQMTILRDEGVYRHIRYKRPSTGNMYFDIITWPGNLCYTGDMGTYVFSRIEDMMYFFAEGKEDEVVTNYYYWTQKAIADSIYGNGIKEYSPELAIDTITEEFKNWKFDYLEDTKIEDEDGNLTDDPYSLEFIEEQWERVEYEIISQAHDGPERVYDAAMCFSIEKDGNGRRGPNFEDFWEYNCEELTYHYQWCCHALNWAVKKYFKHKGINYND